MLSGLIEIDETQVYKKKHIGTMEGDGNMPLFIGFSVLNKELVVC